MRIASKKAMKVWKKKSYENMKKRIRKYEKEYGNKKKNTKIGVYTKILKRNKENVFKNGTEEQKIE